MTRRLRTLLCCLALVLLSVPVHAQDGSEPIRASDLFKIRQLGNVAVSPDGRQVVYTVQSIVETPDAEEGRTYRTHLYLVPADGSAPPRALTRGEHSASDPQWHPEGDRLAFVRTVDGESQVFVLPLTGGETYPITEAEHGASHPRWSPDGTRLLYASSLPEKAVYETAGEAPPWPVERPGRAPDDTTQAAPDPDGSLAAIRAWLGRNEREGDPRVLTRLDFQGEHDLQPALSYRHLFVVDATGADAADTTATRPEPVALTEGFYSFGGGEWMPSGEAVVFSGAPFDEQHPDRVRASDLYVAGADGSDFRRLLHMDGYALRAAAPAPEGEAIAFLARSLDDPGFAQTELGLYTPDADASPRLLTLDFDRSLGSPAWSPDGWHLYTVAPSDGGFPLYRLAPFARDSLQQEGSTPADTGATEATAAPEIERLTPYARGVRSFDVSGAGLFYVITEATNPFELYANTLALDDERRLTRHNASWLADKRLATPEPFTVSRNDTLEVQAWTMRPPFFQEGNTYPLLLEIHGGPSAMWGPGEATMWHEFQYFAAQGYGIVFSNPRGSGGYGYAFEKGNYRDWGTSPAADVLAAAAEAAELPWVNPDQQVVTGGSYAGYLTAWIVAHDDRFQAAVTQRGVYDLATFLGEGNAWRLVPYHFGGYPWEDTAQDTSQVSSQDTSRSPRQVLIENSPLTYVDQIETPLLIIHSDQDLRTGVIQSEMLYKSLKILEKPVEYARYPDAGHDLSRTGVPEQRLDRILRIREFFERYIDSREPSAAGGQ